MGKYRIASYFLMVCLIIIFVTGCGRQADIEKIESTANQNMGMEMENVAPVETTNENDAVSDIEKSEVIETEATKRILIAYFSRADENYGVGFIEKGNTEVIAEIIAEETEGDLFHIKTAEPYPAEYNACTDVAKQEQSDNARPELEKDIDVSDYDVIFVGYPIWWSDCPMAVYSFLEGHDFNGKVIIPFCTHAGSGLAGTEKNIKDACSGAEVYNGLAVSGAVAQNEYDKAKASVLDWLAGLEY